MELYSTQQIHLKKGHRLYPYFDSLMRCSNNLYNVTNYYIRQLFTAFGKEHLSINESEAIAYINGHITALNEQRYTRYIKKKCKSKVVQPFFEFEPVSKENLLSYELLDGIFKVTKHVDYYALPAQVNQQVMKSVFRNWKSYFRANADYRLNPEKYSGKPKIPKYKKKHALSMVTLTNQVCKLKDKHLRFPKTYITLNIGKYFSEKGTLKEVRVHPSYGSIVLEVVFATDKEIKPMDINRIASIDLGVNNLVAMGNNVGSAPVIVKGKVVKSINQYYNKMRGQYYSELRKGKDPSQGVFSSKRLRKLDKKRHLKIKDYFHKTSFRIVDHCKAHNIGTLVIGWNKDFKKDVKLRKADKQNFIHIPYGMLISMIRYKAKAAGIEVVIQEESYTSKASFLDRDIIPVFGEVWSEKFSGKRISRGRYISKHGLIVNADINAAYNIMLKAFPNALEGIRDRGVGLRAVMSTPLILKIA